MKKSTIIGKKQILFGLMILALAGAVVLNMKFSATGGAFSVDSDTDTKILGETTYVNATSGGQEVVATAASADYFETTRSERNTTREDAIKKIEDTINNVKVTAEEKKEALAKLTQITDRMESEASIESLIKAKGFSDALAVISDENINIVVKSDKLDETKTLQIQDIVTSQINIELEKIKIITVK